MSNRVSKMRLETKKYVFRLVFAENKRLSLKPKVIWILRQNLIFFKTSKNLYR
jgi:hypothetical protein